MPLYGFALCMKLGASGSHHRARLTTFVMGAKALRDHQVKDALTELVNLLIQTSESFRHVWALGERGCFELREGESGGVGRSLEG